MWSDPIRSQASRTSHLKTSFRERGKELNNALRMSITSSQVSRSSLPAKSRFQVSHFFVFFPCMLAMPLCLQLHPKAATLTFGLWITTFDLWYSLIRSAEYELKNWGESIKAVGPNWSRIPTTALNSFYLLEGYSRYDKKLVSTKQHTRLCDRRLCMCDRRLNTAVLAFRSNIKRISDDLALCFV